MSGIRTASIQAEHGIPVGNMVTLVLANDIAQRMITSQGVGQIITEEGSSSLGPAAAISVHD